MFIKIFIDLANALKNYEFYTFDIKNIFYYRRYNSVILRFSSFEREKKNYLRDK